jgi:hypothetical protein
MIFGILSLIGIKEPDRGKYDYSKQAEKVPSAEKPSILKAYGVAFA